MDNVNVTSTLTKTQRLILGILILILVDCIWVSSSELTKFIYRNETFEKPFFCTYVQTSMFVLYLLGFLFWPPWRNQCFRPNTYMVLDSEQEDDNFISEVDCNLSNPTFVPVKTPDRDLLDRSSGNESDDSSVRSVRFNKLAEVRQMSESEATEALLARLSYQASLRAGEIAKKAATKLPISSVAKIAFVFCLLWFAANYTFQVALAKTEAGVVTVVSSTSSLFTLLLAAWFPSNAGDKFTFSKLVAVCLTITGVTLVSLSNMNLESRLPVGVLWSLFSAMFYAMYLVFLKRKVENEEMMDIPLFFGFVGLFNVILLWPLFIFFHYSEWENFEWPNGQQLMVLLLNGLLGTAISEVLWLWGCFLTSSLIATVAISLTIPMCIFADVLLKKVSYPYLFYTGTVPVIVSFLAVTLLSHYENWDPVLDALKCVFYRMCRRTRFIRFRFPDVPSEQTEALIGINSSNEHDA